MKWFVLSILLAVAGCYEVEQEVIPVSQGIRAPIESPITWDDGGETSFSYVETTRDYRFRDRDDETGSARAIHIRDDIYLLQVRYDNESVYGLFFFQVTPTRIDLVLPVGDVESLAVRHNVDMEEDYIYVEYILSGSSENILSFLRAHAQFEFQIDDS